MRSQYIDDAVLSGIKDDKLKHLPLAAEVATLAGTQPTPLNIALFGPWGAGKSSLGVLLKAEIKRLYPNHRFVVINAWKHSQDSFRRQFILETARQLGLGEEHYRKRLYQKTKRAKFKTDWSTWTGLAVIFGVAMVLFVLAMLAVAALTSYMSETPYKESVAALLSRGFGSAIVSAGLLAAVVALLGRLFTSDVEESEVSSEERFEALFKQLVKKATGFDKKKRIVFFIDELDRCEPSRLVSVLESIRTFLDVKSCVFVVAADDRVLESAVKEEMPHAVPDEAGNPYYSSGAEYLDKLFQHQIAIPPLLARRLTQFAADLTAHRSGVWGEADRAHVREHLVSVLVPSHVRSPRRAKVLLNGFVSTYESAVGRHAMDESAPNPLDRLLELAKLSTLRLEFPLFYRDLIAHPHLAIHLTEYVLAGCNWTDELRRTASLHGVLELAEQYSKSERPAETMLSSADSDPEGETDEVDDVEESVPASADRARRNELLSYLRKTAHVPGPSRDIIFLESGGAAYGLTDDIADSIETYAADGNAKALDALLDKAQVDPDAAIGILHQLQSELLGIEAENALDAALRLAHKSPDLDANTAGALVEDVRKVSVNNGGLRLSWLQHIIRVGSVAKHPDGAALVQQTIADERLHDESNIDTAVAVLAEYAKAPAFVAASATNLIIGQSPGMLSKLMILPQIERERLVQLVQDDSFRQACGDYWLNNRDEVAEDELADFAAVVDWADSNAESDTLWWCLSIAVAVPLADFIDRWVAYASTTPETPEQMGLLVSTVGRVSKDYWDTLLSIGKDGPKTDSPALHAAGSVLLADATAVGTIDPKMSALLELLTSAWGSPPDSGLSGEDAYLSSAWATPGRQLGHRVVLRLARAEDNTAGPWRGLLARDYCQLVAEQADSMSDDERIALSDELAAEWSAMSGDDRVSIVTALRDSQVAPADMKMLWNARIAATDASFAFPFEASDLADMDTGSRLTKASIAVWLSQVATPEDVAEFSVQGLLNGDASFDDDIIAALNRFTPDDRAVVARAVIGPNPSGVSEPLLRASVKDVDSPEFASWMGEQLREASNDDRRNFLLGVWRIWGPSADSVRKPLVEALTAIASTGKGTFMLVLRNLDLAAAPPQGTKGALVQAVQQRAGVHGETKKARAALEKAGLIKPKWGRKAK